MKKTEQSEEAIRGLLTYISIPGIPEPQAGTVRRKNWTYGLGKKGLIWWEPGILPIPRGGKS